MIETLLNHQHHPSKKKHRHHVELLFCIQLFTTGEIPSNASTRIQLKLTERPLLINLMVSAAICVCADHM